MIWKYINTIQDQTTYIELKSSPA